MRDLGIGRRTRQGASGGASGSSLPLQGYARGIPETGAGGQSQRLTDGDSRRRGVSFSMLPSLLAVLPKTQSNRRGPGGFVGRTANARLRGEGGARRNSGSWRRFRPGRFCRIVRGNQRKSTVRFDCLPEATYVLVVQGNGCPRARTCGNQVRRYLHPGKRQTRRKAATQSCGPFGAAGLPKG